MQFADRGGFGGITRLSNSQGASLDDEGAVTTGRTPLSDAMGY